MLDRERFSSRDARPDAGGSEREQVPAFDRAQQLAQRVFRSSPDSLLVAKGAYRVTAPGAESPTHEVRVETYRFGVVAPERVYMFLLVAIRRKRGLLAKFGSHRMEISDGLEMSLYY